MKRKFDLWNDCPYWPRHKFKKNVCTGCGFKKPKLRNLFQEIREAKSSLETRIDKILKLREETENYSISWYNYPNLSDVYGNQKLDGYFGEPAPIVAPSAPLPGAKKTATHSQRRVAAVLSFYDKNWPKLTRTLDELFEAKTLKPEIRSHAETFVRSLMLFKTVLT